MNPIVITGLFDVAAKLINHFFPNAEQQEAARIKLLEMVQNGELKKLESEVMLAQGQMEINKAEASSTDFFRGGWRPFIGWICGVGLAFQFVVRPIANWTIALNGSTIFLPGLELETLMTLLFGMLGLGAYRTYEKRNGVDK